MFRVVLTATVSVRGMIVSAVSESRETVPGLKRIVNVPVASVVAVIALLKAAMTAGSGWPPFVAATWPVRVTVVESGGTLGVGVGLEGAGELPQAEAASARAASQRPRIGGSVSTREI